MVEYDSARLNRAIQKFPLVDYLTQHGAEQLDKYEYQLACPTCGKDKLVVNTRKRVWRCWICEGSPTIVIGRGGLLSLIRVLDGVDKGQAVAAVLQSFRDIFSIEQLKGELALTYMELAEGQYRKVPLPADCRPAWLDFDGRLPYAHRRGLTAHDCYAFGLYWCPTGRYANRLFFPVFEGTVPVYWQARAMWEEREHRGPERYVKSLNPPKPHCGVHSKHDPDCGPCRHLASNVAGSSDILMNLDRACQYKSVVVTEGPIDAIHVGTDAVCTFGKRLSPAQVGKLLSAGVREIELMWDGPGPTERLGAWPEMWTTAKQLAGLFDIRLVFLPQGDPGDYTREQLTWLRQHRTRRLSDAKHRLLEV